MEHGTLGTFKKSTFFRFSKISNLTPPGQFLTFFWPTFLKAVPFFANEDFRKIRKHKNGTALRATFEKKGQIPAI